MNDLTISKMHGELKINHNGQVVYRDYSSNGSFL